MTSFFGRIFGRSSKNQLWFNVKMDQNRLFWDARSMQRGESVGFWKNSTYIQPFLLGFNIYFWALNTHQNINLRQEVWLDGLCRRVWKMTQIQMEWTIDFGSHVHVWKIKLSDIEIHVCLFRLAHVCEMDVQQHDGNFAAFPFVGCQTFWSKCLDFMEIWWHELDSLKFGLGRYFQGYPDWKWLWTMAIT